MKGRGFLLASAAALTLTFATAANAQAERFLSRATAQSNAADDATTRYGDTLGFEYSDVEAFCQPQFRPYQSGYLYEKWACTWSASFADGGYCHGRVRIRGRVGRAGDYYSRVIRGASCD
ncbi:MAG: hypothetical protein JWM31_2400 [Solirubrobacterales bacterium]|nr:hypothetical protein [Solirubrobacterales bacterium]